jgi:hypothetical protein
MTREGYGPKRYGTADLILAKKSKDPNHTKKETPEGRDTPTLTHVSTDLRYTGSVRDVKVRRICHRFREAPTVTDVKMRQL